MNLISRSRAGFSGFGFTNAADGADLGNIDLLGIIQGTQFTVLDPTPEAGGDVPDLPAKGCELFASV